jgi:formate-nitrite transporter family protein
MAEPEKLRLKIPINDHDHVMGPMNASVTVVNYGDYECPDCHRRHRAIQKVIDELGDTVRFAYRHFPLVKVHPNALRAAEAAEAAAAQNKFWEMHRLLYLHPDKLADKDLRRYAQEIGLDLGRFDREMANSIYSDQILKDYYNSLVYGISGTPTTFINGVLHAMSSTELIAIVRTILQQQLGKQ